MPSVRTVAVLLFALLAVATSAAARPIGFVCRYVSPVDIRCTWDASRAGDRVALTSRRSAVFHPQHAPPLGATSPVLKRIHHRSIEAGPQVVLLSVDRPEAIQEICILDADGRQMCEIL